ncbi:MAG: uroporphyrinogen decarboxylase family protein, partial [Candidatus Poribacteria bacterium]
MKNKMSGRERLLRVFRQQETDRMPIWLWGVDPMFKSGRPSWEPLYELVEKYELDIMRSWAPRPKNPPSNPAPPPERSQSEYSDMWEYKFVIKTPKGNLTQIYLAPKDGSPGYVKKDYIKTAEDAEKWLSLPHNIVEPDLDIDSYFDLLEKTGDRTIIMVGIGEAMYSIEALMGSETFGFFLMDHRDLLHEMISRAYENIENFVKYCLKHNIGDYFGWVGPELCIPPLASPKDFREFVFKYDKPIIDLIHDAGKLVWVHCHGDMKPVLLDFVEMGVDCLNPIEPPPVGGLTLAEAKKLVNGRMTLDGGVENGAFDL